MYIIDITARFQYIILFLIIFSYLYLAYLTEELSSSTDLDLFVVSCRIQQPGSYYDG